MAGKHYLIWTIVVLFVLGIIAFISVPYLFDTSENADFKFYIRVFLVMFAINTFAILRLYNSIVQNTRFSIELRKAFLKFQQSVPTLERAMRNLNSSLGTVRSSSEQLKRSLDSNTVIIEKNAKVERRESRENSH